MDTPVSKKPKKSMYYKMMRKAGMKKKMETDPAQWAQETPGPAKTGARSMENGDVVRRAGHGGGVVSDGPVAAVQPARRRDGENRKAAIAKTTNALTGIVLAALVAFASMAMKDPAGTAALVHAALDKSRNTAVMCALLAIATRPRLGFTICVLVAGWTVAAHAAHLPGFKDMSIVTGLVPGAVWASAPVGFLKLALLGDHK
jgi:hypothetical protein